MSDPFERLREISGGPAPDPGAIRARARRIRARRTTAASVVAVAAVAVIAVLAIKPRDASRLLLDGPVASSGTQTAAPVLRATVAPAGRASDVTVSSTPVAAAGSKPPKAPTPPAPVAASAAKLSIRLEIQPSTVGAGQEQVLRLIACNTTSAPASADFGSSQRYDFEVSRGGAVVWRWSTGRAFLQTFATEPWEPQQCRTVAEERWRPSDQSGTSLAPGSYTVVGIFTSTTKQRTTPQAMCVVAC